MEKLILVRHGQTDWNLMKKIQGGGSDIPLNDTGRLQAENVALRLRSENLSAIYSSPLQRALETAHTVARYHKLEVLVESALKELDVGELEGFQISGSGKHLSHYLFDESTRELRRMPGGESLADLQQRVWGMVNRLVTRHPDSTVAIVAHSFVILTAVCSTLGLHLSQIGRFRLGSGSISTIAFDGQVTRLLSLNENHHILS